MDSSEFKYNTEINIKKIPFIYKLWIVINSTKNDAIKWSSNGNSICINVTNLTKYLKDNVRNIFICKSIAEFLSLLEQFGFSKCDEDKSLEDVENNVKEKEQSSPKTPNGLKSKVENIKSSEFIYYENSNFLKERFDLIKNISKLQILEKSNNEESTKNPLIEKESFEEIKIKSEFNDEINPTQKIIKQINLITRKKLFLTITLKKERCLDILREQTCPYNNSAVIPIPADIFKSSSESVSGFEEKMEYAGFYGNFIDISELQNIFGNYLPVYLQGNDDNGDIEMNQIQNNQDSLLEDSIQMNNTEDSNNNSSNNAFPAVENSDNVNMIQCKISTEDLIKAAPLEPIFNADSTDIDNDDDISMDEYLKFNTKNCDSNDTETEDTNDIPIDNITDNATKDKSISSNIGNEVNNNENANDSEDYSFKSFFSQYSNSMNVLLEE